MAPQELSLPGTAQRNRRAALTMAALFALSVCLTVVCANWYLENSRSRLLRELEQDMDMQASSKVALLTVWSGSLVGQVNVFVTQDMLRLFAAEVSGAHVPARDLLEMAQKYAGDEAAPETEQPSAMGQAAPVDADPLKNLAPRLPLMLNQLKEFIEKNSFWGACLINTDMQVYLTPGPMQTFDERQKAYLEEALRTRRPVFMPVRRLNGELVMDMVFPIFAPLYVDQTGETVVSLLLTTYNVLPLAKAATRHTGNGNELDTAILQSFGETLQRIDPSVPSGVVDLPGWNLNSGRLALETRTDPGLPADRQKIFALARPVPNLPWLVEQGISVSRIEEKSTGLRSNVIMVSLLLVTLAGVILAALWWALVGRNERAVAAQMRRLYLVVNQQKQILDGVNSALSAGVVLNDLDGVIFYANDSFARMAGREAAALRGVQHTELGPEFAGSLVAHTLAVYESGGSSSFTEALPAGGKQRYFLTSCTPFRDEDGQLAGVVSVYSDMTDLALAQQRAQQMVTQTVNAFVRSIEAVDTYLRGQSALTAHLSVMLACSLGRTDAETLATLRTAANLSQMGMIQLPKDLLTKTETLTSEERAEMQKHVEYAREALAGIDFGLPVLEAITQMYERIDGSGYPLGLQGEAICDNARILAAANTFCALMRPRSYRMAHSMESALRILSETPPKYDPDIVRALRGFLRTEQGRAFLDLLADDQPDAA